MNENEFIFELNKIGINPTKGQLELLKKYYSLLIEWNEKINLTALTEEKEVYLKHFYDSLTMNKVIDLNKVDSLCDIGSGAGFPGMVIKIMFPNIKVTLVDSLNKRVNFLNTVIDSLNLENIEVIHDRIEDYGKKNRDKFSVVTARAVTNLPVLLEYAMPITKVGGYFIPLKGSIDEIDSCVNALKVLNTSKVEQCEFFLPIENSKRIIYKFRRNGFISNKYPRSNAEIKRNSL